MRLAPWPGDVPLPYTAAHGPSNDQPVPPTDSVAELRRFNPRRWSAKMTTSQCAQCGAGSPQLKYVTRSFGKGAALLVIEGIPMWSCSRCGESYFTAQTMHEIERIKALRKSVAVSRSVPVAAFEATDA
jgi:YgiT-type zinc finger domain-containing protein